jgi:hypothetical protein
MLYFGSGKSRADGAVLTRPSTWRCIVNHLIKEPSAAELSEIQSLINQIHDLVDRLVTHATDGRRTFVDEIELVRDDERLVIKGDIPKESRLAVEEDPLQAVRAGGILIEVPLTGDDPVRVVGSV